MTRSSLTVIKVGGSLFDWPEFPRRLSGFVDARKALDRDERLVLIAGGGPAADVVRALDRIHGLGDQAAHRLALRAMDLTAYFLSAIVPGAVLVEHGDDFHRAWTAGLIPVLAPRCIIAEIERTEEHALPASWDVTSDSIAAQIASHLAADRLILLKSAPLPDNTDRHQAVRLGLVDAMLPLVARSLRRVEYMNLRDQGSRPQPLPP